MLPLPHPPQGFDQVKQADSVNSAIKAFDHAQFWVSETGEFWKRSHCFVLTITRMAAFRLIELD